MSSNTLKDISAGLSSALITKKRKAGKDLKNLLGEGAASEEITKNQIKKNGPTWEDFFLKTHDWILKEAELWESTCNNDTQRLLCSSLLQAIVSGANLKKAHIDCSKIIRSCLHILTSSNLIQVIGNAYIAILEKSVFTVQYYLEYFNQADWSDLLATAIDLIFEESVDNLLSVRLLAQILSNGPSRCQLVLPIRNALPRFTDMFVNKNYNNLINLQCSLLEVAISVVKNVASESRLVVCKFTEEIIPHIMKYEQTIDTAKQRKKLMFRFLYLSIVVHHPGGRANETAGTLAHNTELWASCLASIRQLLCTEAAAVSRSPLHTSRHLASPPLCPDFIALIVESCHQVFNNPWLEVPSNSSCEETPSKKSRPSSQQCRTLSEAASLINCSFYPWTKIIGEYFKKYGHTVTSSEKVFILDTLRSVASGESSDIKSADLNETIIAVYQHVNASDWNTLCQEASVDIWNTCIRKVSMETDSFESSHDVIQTLLKMKVFKAPISGLIKIYTTLNKKPTKASLRSLTYLLSEYNHQITDLSVRLTIAQANLSDLSEPTLRVYFPQVFFQLIVRENYNTIKIKTPLKRDILYKVFDSLDSIMLITDFEEGMLQKEKDINDANEATLLSFTMWEKVAEVIVESLNSSLSKDTGRSKDSGLFIPELVNECYIALKLTSFLIEHNITCLLNVQLLKHNISEALDTIAAYLPSKLDRCQANEKIKILTDIKQLYLHQQFCSDVINIVREKTTQEMFECIFKLANERDDCGQVDNFEMMDISSDNAETPENPIKAITLELIMNLALMDLVKLDEDVLRVDLFDFTNKNDFVIFIDCVSFILNNFPDNDIPLGLIFTSIQEMTKQLYRDPDATVTILTLLYDILEPVNRFGSLTNKKNCIITLQGFLQRICAQYYGPRVLGRALKCFSWMRKQTQLPGGDCWKLSTQFDDYLLKCLSSDLHCVSLYSCHCISHYMRESSKAEFMQLVNTLPEVFKLDATDLSAIMKSDEGANRTSSVLHCLALIALSSPVWDKMAMATILQIAHKKNISPQLLKKVFKYISDNLGTVTPKNIISDNVDFLVSSWLKADLPISMFPYSLVDCWTNEEFYTKYRQAVVPHQVLWAHDGQLNTILEVITSNTDASIQDALAECLPISLSLSLPYIVVEQIPDDDWKPSKKEILSGKNLFKSNMERFGRDRMVALMKDKIVDIVKALIFNVFDPENITKDLGWTGAVPHVEGPYLCKNAFTSAINYLNNMLDFEIFLHLCETNISGIKDIFLDLWERIEAEPTQERKLLRLQQYWVFCNSLPLTTDANSFICSFIVHSTVHIINKNKDIAKMKHLCVAACKILNIMAVKMLPELTDIVSKFLPLVVYTVSHAAMGDELFKDCSVKLLSFLLIDMRESLVHTIQSLDPLPNCEDFREINSSLGCVRLDSENSLKEHIGGFLNGGIVGRFEGLKRFHAAIKASKLELADMFRQMKDLRFLDDCRSSDLHNLMSTLIYIASDKTDEQSSLQACCCLGELGVADYQTLMLCPPTEPFCSPQPVENLATVALGEIRKLFYDADPKVAKAAAKALTSLLLYKEGKQSLELVINNCPLVRKLMLPFNSTERVFSAKIKICSSRFEEFLYRHKVWQMQDEWGHSRWIIQFTTDILRSFSEDNCFLHQLIDICKLKESLCGKLLPPLVGLLLSHGNQQEVNRLSTQIKCFFDDYYMSTFVNLKRDSSSFTSTSDEDVLSNPPKSIKYPKESVRCMLDIVEFIRLQKSKSGKRKSDTGFSLDFLQVAWAACSTGAHFLAIYYGDLWCGSLQEDPPSTPDKIAALPQGENMLKILRKSYLAIGDSDALYGCGSAHLSDPAERSQDYLRAGFFTDALLMHDLTLPHEEGSPNQHFLISSSADMLMDSRLSERSCTRVLQTSGLYRIASQYMKALGSSSALDDMTYECFWRLGDWSLQIDAAHINSKLTKQSSAGLMDNQVNLELYWPAYQYVCLRNCLTKSIETSAACLAEALKDARNYVTSGGNFVGLQGCQNAYDLAAKLQMLREIEFFGEVKCKEGTSCQSYEDLVDCWAARNILPFSDFKQVEPVLAQRSVILDDCFRKVDRVPLQVSIAKLQLEYAELALDHGWVQACSRWVTSASRAAKHLRRVAQDSTQDSVRHLSGLALLAESRAAWAGGHSDVALHLVKTLINKSSIDPLLYANSLRQCGSWMVETRSERPTEILQKYMNVSLNALGPRGDIRARMEAYLIIAKFTDAEYKHLDLYIKSPDFITKQKILEKGQECTKSLKNKHEDKTTSLSKDESKVLMSNIGQCSIDKNEIQTTFSEKNRYLHEAMRNYLLYLCYGDDNLCAFRAVSLWLENPNMELCGTSRIDFLRLIPSYKLLPLLPQLAPHLDHREDTLFHNDLYYLVEKCVIEHPHHALPVVLALKNSHKDWEILNKAAQISQRVKTENNSVDEPYVATAKIMIERLIAEKPGNLATIIRETDTLSLAMISLAYYQVKRETLKYPIPQAEPLLRIGPLQHALLPTLVLPVNPSSDYTSIPSVMKFDTSFDLVGGINNPKRLQCIGTDGIVRHMLLKGEDDIRQDAVMQQVFEVVNRLLATNKHTKRRRLLIRTYKVVVLSRRSGIIEWCSGTETLGRYLIGEKRNLGAHCRLRPSDISPEAAKQLMDDKNKKKSPDEKLKIFKKILSQLKPVFHHFFLETFLMPSLWYEKRLAYIHSVATSSMIGYVLGLGDRHVQNILIDKKTAEVIHIDLGIAFEQGRVLPTPETVPFRLTQDIVAGLGPAGIEGVFRRSCEKTMDVMKENHEALLTILEVLLCDPLYLWTIAMKQGTTEQPTERSTGGEGGGSNSEAERALMCVRNKLRGVEMGSVLATPGQVAQLLLKATDLGNLSRLYSGWQSYL